MAELHVEALKQSVVRSGGTAVIVNDSDWQAIIAALEDRDRLREAATEVWNQWNHGDELEDSMAELRAALEGRDG